MTTTQPLLSEDNNMVLLSKFYRPPLLPPQAIPYQGEGKPKRRRRRNGKGGGGDSNRLIGAKKRKLTTEQINLLEYSFENEHKLETERKDKLASELGLHPRQVAIWFQNRRARYKSKQLEEDFLSLKNKHDTVLLQNRALESEVSRLKEKLSEVEIEKQKLIQQQLAETEKEIKKLTEGCGENSHSSGSPQLTIETTTEDTITVAQDDNEVKDIPFLEPIEGCDGTMYWTGHYRGYMMGYGSLWDDDYFFPV